MSDTDATGPRPTIVPDPLDVPRTSRPSSPSDRPPIPDRPATPPEGSPAAASGATAPPYDAARERLRMTLDRILYGAALASIVFLQCRGQLDVGVGALILLVVGLRPHALADVLVARTGAARGAAAIVSVGAASGAAAATWRSLFGT